MHYKLSYDVRVVAEAGIKAIESASHGGVVQVDLKGSPPRAALSEEGAGHRSPLPVLYLRPETEALSRTIQGLSRI